MRLQFSKQAAEDIEEIGDFIALDNPEAAVRFIGGLRKRCAQVLNAPKGGMERPELLAGIRSVPFGRYIIFYQEDAETVLIVRVLHSARDIAAVLSEGEDPQ